MNDVGASMNIPPHEAGMLQRLDVFGDGGKRHVEWLCELGDGPIAFSQQVKHSPAGGIAEGVEDSIESGVTFLNHSVE